MGCTCPKDTVQKSTPLSPTSRVQPPKRMIPRHVWILCYDMKRRSSWWRSELLGGQGTRYGHPVSAEATSVQRPRSPTFALLVTDRRVQKTRRSSSGGGSETVDFSSIRFSEPSWSQCRGTYELSPVALISEIDWLPTFTDNPPNR